MDKGIVILVEKMNDVLSFVVDTDTLRSKLTSLTDTIQNILATIKDCSTAIHNYLNSGVIGMYCLKYSLWIRCLTIH